MLGKKGLNSGILFIAAIMVVLVGAIAFVGVQQLAVQPTKAVEADGEWDTLQAPQEVAGSDLTVTKTDISDDTSYTAANGSMVTSYDLNGTDGDTHYLAFGIEVSTNRLDDVSIEGVLDDLTTSQVKIRKAYIVPDEEGVNLDSEDAVYMAEVPTDQDEFTFDISSLPEGEYVVGVEAKAISTSAIASGDDIVEIDFDGDSSDDVESFTADIQNVAASA